MKRKKKKPRPYQNRTEHYDSNFDNSNVMTTPEVAALFRLHFATILKLYNAGELPGVRCGNQVRYWRPNLMAIINGGRIG